MKVTRTVEFDAAHRLMWHDGKCRRLHGHTYTVDVTVEGNVEDFDGIENTGPPTAGMVIDFATLDRVLREAFLDEWDHRTLLYLHDPLVPAIRKATRDDDVVVMDCPPTAEYLAAIIGEAVNDALVPYHVSCTIVSVHESPRSIATWELER